MTNKTILKVNLVISVLIFTIVCSTSALSFLMSSNPSIFAKIQKNCFDAKLTGKSEVPPKDTKATGFVQLNANEGNNSMSYKINVTNIEKATSVHLHQGKVGENGPSMVIPFKTDFPSPITNGVLSGGNFTSANLENQSPVKNLKDLINMMNNGDVYVHVHTEANPAGEIRGQLLSCDAKV
ncbi:MAG: CHRD domain-containing protein [Candidatus Nitrosocosmicus sp.]